MNNIKLVDGIQLKHLDQINIGLEQIFKLVIPKMKTSSKNTSISNPYDNFIASQLNHESESSKNLRKLIDYIKSKTSKSEFNIQL